MLLTALINIHTTIVSASAKSGGRTVQISSAPIGDKAVSGHLRAVGECAFALTVVEVAGVIGSASTACHRCSARSGEGAAFISHTSSRGVADTNARLILSGRTCDSGVRT